ncbi:zinc ribbon domain-containing protein, partial [uncultured Enorma sp.]|uniref:zinc ribbon domain-containing protein n=1 Tax=uncultured Enorma sp. TaxID=1714346 RepID=UPI0025D16244
AAQAAPASRGSAPAGGAAVAGGMNVPDSAVPAPTSSDASNVQGQSQESQGKRFCPYCGKPVGSASAKFCTSCGKGLPE